MGGNVITRSYKTLALVSTLGKRKRQCEVEGGVFLCQMFGMVRLSSRCLIFYIILCSHSCSLHNSRSSHNLYHTGLSPKFVRLAHPASFPFRMSYEFLGKNITVPIRPGVTLLFCCSRVWGNGLNLATL